MRFAAQDARDPDAVGRQTASCGPLERLSLLLTASMMAAPEPPGFAFVGERGVRQTISVAYAIFLALSMEGLHAQTIEELQSEGVFVRALIRARDAGDCHLALRLLDERRAIIQSQAIELARSERYPAIESDSEGMYLFEQIRNLENRRAIMIQECR